MSTYIEYYGTHRLKATIQILLLILFYHQTIIIINPSTIIYYNTIEGLTLLLRTLFFLNSSTIVPNMEAEALAS